MADHANLTDQIRDTLRPFIPNGEPSSELVLALQGVVIEHVAAALATAPSLEVREAVLEERRACARIAHEVWDSPPWKGWQAAADIRDKILDRS